MQRDLPAHYLDAQTKRPIRHSYHVVDNNGSNRVHQSPAKRRKLPFLQSLIPTAARRENWLPGSLRLRSLILFVVLLLCLLSALITVQQYAKQHDGIRLLTLNHYTWTYGPTAIFIIIISYWRLVDYHCKALVPWAEVRNGPANADRSILLDHISPFLVVTFGAATRKRHVAVALTIVGFILLKVITIASTGLFFVSTVTVGPFDVDMVQTSQFDVATNFSGQFSDPGPSPFYNAYAVMQRGLPLTEGLTSDMLYETYRPAESSSHTNSTYAVQSRAFVPRVTCEEVAVEAIINRDEFGSTVNQYEQLQIQNTTVWSCPPRSALTSDGITILTCDAGGRICPARQLFPSFGSSGCVRTGDEKGASTSPYLVAISDVRISQTFNESITDYALHSILEPSSWDFQIPKITGMLCSIAYEMSDVRLFYNTSRTGNPVQWVEKLSTPGDTFMENLSSEFFARKLSYAAPTSVGGARDMFGLVTDFDYLEEQPHTVLSMVANASNYKYLLEHVTEFMTGTEYVLNSMLLQIAKESIIIRDTNRTFQPSHLLGQETFPFQRLEVQPVSLIVMLICLAVLAVLSVALVFVRPETGTPDNPETIAATLKTLRNSDELHSVFEQTAICSERVAWPLLRQATFQSQPTRTGTILDSSFAKSSDSLRNHTRNSRLPQHYSPLTLTKVCLTITVLSAPIAIALLEYLQRLSDSGLPGIAFMQDTSSIYVSIYTRYLPALAALLIATCFNCLDFNTAMLAPFQKMRSGPVSHNGMKTSLLAKLPPMALVSAIRRRYWAACFTNIGALIGSVLTIVISGLYTMEYIPDPVNMTISTTDSWNLSYRQGVLSDNAAAAVSSLLESGDLSYPTFTFGELVFPALEVNSEALQVQTLTAGLLTAEVPALRAQLVCEEVGWNMVNYSIESYSYKGTAGAPQVRVEGTIPLPEGCQLGSAYGNESSIPLTILPLTFAQPVNTTYFATVQDIHVGPWSDTIMFDDTGKANKEQPENPPGCPSVVLVYGYLDGTAPSKSTWTTLRCDQKIQEVMTNVTFEVPDLRISTEFPPVTDESTAKYLLSGTEDETSWWYWLQSNLEWPFHMFNESAIDPFLVKYDNGTSGNDFAKFFRGAFFGRTPLPLETMQRSDADSKALIFDHVQKFYRRYMAQYISSNLRVGASSPDTSRINKRDDIILSVDPIQGSFTNAAGTLRLIQHRTPKLVMQIMLAIMFICASLALWLGKYHDLVLWNPCTIAGIMVLFAGSKMCSPDQPRASIERLDLHDELVGENGDLQQHSTGYEMTNISRPHAKGYSHVSQTGEALDEDNNKNAFVTSRGSEDVRKRHKFDWQDSQARFRLGWWRNGVYVGSRKGLDEKDADRGMWRYGIDVL